MNRLISTLIAVLIRPITDRLDAIEENITALEKDWHRHDGTLYCEEKPGQCSEFCNDAKSLRITPPDEYKTEIKGEFVPPFPTCTPTCSDCYEFPSCPVKPPEGSTICFDFIPKGDA